MLLILYQVLPRYERPLQTRLQLPPLTIVTAYIWPPPASSAFLVDFDEGFVRRFASHFAVNVDAPIRLPRARRWRRWRSSAVAARTAASASGSEHGAMRAAGERKHENGYLSIGVPEPSRTDPLRSITPSAQSGAAPWDHARAVPSGHGPLTTSPDRTAPERTPALRRRGGGTRYFNQTLSCTR